MDRTENLCAYGRTAAASGLVGLVVGMTALLVQLYEPAMLRILLASVLAGAIIGTCTRGICVLLPDQFYRRPVFLWTVVLMTIGLGTVVAAEYIGSLPLGKVAVLVAVAEIFGLAVAYTDYRRFIYINDKLRQRQEQLREE